MCIIVVLLCSLVRSYGVIPVIMTALGKEEEAKEGEQPSVGRTQSVYCLET